MTSYDTARLRLRNVEGSMWERFQKHLNRGWYEEAEHERLDRTNEQLRSAGKDVSLVELLGVAQEDAEKIRIHYNGTVHEVAVDEFYKAIEGIVLRDIADVSLERQDADGFVIPNGLFVTINGTDGHAFITDDCKVDKHGLHFSRLPVGAYTMQSRDRARIMALLPADGCTPPLSAKPSDASILYIAVPVAVGLPVVIAIGRCRRKRG